MGNLTGTLGKEGHTNNVECDLSTDMVSSRPGFKRVPLSCALVLAAPVATRAFGPGLNPMLGLSDHTGLGNHCSKGAQLGATNFQGGRWRGGRKRLLEVSLSHDGGVEDMDSREQRESEEDSHMDDEIVSTLS